METAQQMDNALQRRSKSKNPTSSSNQMTDSEKIALQMFLDGQAYGVQIEEICSINCQTLPAYCTLMNEINESKKLIESK